jgi:hypothetical protein
MKPVPTIAALAAILILTHGSPALAGFCKDTSRKASSDIDAHVETKVKNNWQGGDVQIRISTRKTASDSWSVKKNWTTVRSGKNDKKLLKGVDDLSFRVEIKAGGQTATCLYKTQRQVTSNPVYSQAKFTWKDYSCSIPDTLRFGISCEKSFKPPSIGSSKARWNTKLTVISR